MPPEGLESSVDGLGRPVRAVGVVEEREDVRHAAFEGASERDESGASGCFASMFVRQVRQCFSAVWADGFPRCRHRFPVM